MNATSLVHLSMSKGKKNCCRQAVSVMTANNHTNTRYISVIYVVCLPGFPQEIPLEILPHSEREEQICPLSIVKVCYSSERFVFSGSTVIHICVSVSLTATFTRRAGTFLSDLCINPSDTGVLGVMMLLRLCRTWRYKDFLSLRPLTLFTGGITG